MQLVIDIPKEMKEEIDSGIIHYDNRLRQAVINGIPLDSIRDEIEASKWTNKDMRTERNSLASGLDKALEIIDKYRAESEGM